MKRSRAIFIFLAMGSLAFYGCKKYALSEGSATSQSISAKAADAEANATGAVYVLSNQASGNSVLVFTRSSNGTLSASNSYPTSGNGTGNGLGSQGSVTLQDVSGNSFLFAANAGPPCKKEGYQHCPAPNREAICSLCV